MKILNKILDWLGKNTDIFLSIFFLIIAVVLCLLWYDWKLFLIIFLLAWSNNHNEAVRRKNIEKEKRSGLVNELLKKVIDKNN